MGRVCDLSRKMPYNVNMSEKMWQNIKRRWIFYAVDALIVGVFIYFHLTSGAYSIRDLKLAESYGLLAALFLYLAVLAPAAGRLFDGYYAKRFAEREKAFFASSILLAGFHVYFAFFKTLGGFDGLGFLSATYLRAFVLGLITLAFMFVFLKIKILTSQNIYLVLLRAGLVVMIFLHAILIGSHFKNFAKPLPIIVTLLLYILLLLYANVVAKYFSKNKAAASLVLVILTTSIATSFVTSKLGVSGSTGSMQGHSMSMAPAKSTRYTVSLTPNNFEVGKKTKLELSVYDAATGEDVKDFEIVHEKLVHLVIVDESLEWYSHIHPEWDGRKFIVDETFPKAGAYRAYASFQVKGDSEQVYAFRLLVGDVTPKNISKVLDGHEEKVVDGYRVSLKERDLTSSGVKQMKAYMDFQIKDSNGQNATNLYPYLGAFGHLVMISTTDYSYIHVHPTRNPVIPDDTTGPLIEFMVMGDVKPGVYKLFGQFAPDKKVITAPFTVEVK